ncbi:aspartate/glutamate racemase family protein [Desulfosarcina sp.]|uniref:aspartate/glutamate racemase family protein n=1 Tax=Desulfosarcina sp. TaxID=2027861 RepID=UPI00356AF61E
MSSHSHRSPKKPVVGILMLETTFPRIRGDIGNPQTFPFPVLYQTVNGASPQRVVIEADAGLIDGFIDSGLSLVEKGVKAVATSCGFLALFHRQLVTALPVPVFTSSLLQVHMANSVIRSGQKIGIITANKKSLTDAHLAGVGIQNYPLAIVGMEDAKEFSAVFIGGKATLDERICQREMLTAANRLMRTHPDVGAIVLECTNMPPYADKVRRATGVPVFDAVTLVNFAHSLLT